MTQPTKLNLRLPTGLHDHLAEQAEANGTSLNTYLLTVLAGATHYVPAPPDEQPEEER